VPLVLVSRELLALVAECPRGGRGLFEHAYGFVRHGTVWLSPDDGYGPSCSAVEVVWQLPATGWPRWLPTLAQDRFDRQTRRRHGR
jgi:hypothetical protein